MIGTCTAIDYLILGLTIPNLSLIAFTLITLGLSASLWAHPRTAPPDEPVAP